MKTETKNAGDGPAERGVRPSAWEVWWGICEMRRNSVHFERETAANVAVTIKSHTEIRPLYDQAALDAAVSAERERCAEVLRKLLAQIEALDDNDPQPDLSCIDWMHAAIGKVVGPNTEAKGPRSGPA
jgi:hypothetical protein